ncbi:MAG: adenylate/guanylate cyclase domain-containing protein [Betaproteobacteria bacterium]|nr:MAG: adenylate/guanylate cyclase domain-containing protein [Betaproteobacteria bacterium]
MTQQPLFLAILFADISGSTRLYDTLGDKAALAKIEQCLTRLDGIARRHGGEVVKTIGDEIMCDFPSAASAVEAAMAMQQEMSALAASTQDPLRIRIGLHFGEVIREGGDIFGDAVNVAARMAGLAAAEQIMTTRHTADSLPPALRASIRFLGQTTVKGKREDIQICEAIWKADAELTMMPTTLPGMAHSGRTAALALSHAGRQLTLTPQQPSAVVGRDKTCGMVVDDPLASRHHARIELRNGKFILVDQSTNGTYLNQDGKTIFLHREEIPLSGSGIFSLGHDAKADAPQAVHYCCEY